MGDFGGFQHSFVSRGKKGGHIDITKSMEDFQDFISLNNLMDVELGGSIFTWSNRRKGDQLIQVKLDRALISWGWLKKEFGLFSLPRIGSDHNPILFQIKEKERRRVLFRFEYMWLLDEDITELLKKWWNIKIKGMTLFRIVKKPFSC